MPGIARAMKVQKRARSVGFDWDDPQEVLEALRGEISELEGADGDVEAVAGELGDVFFTAVNLARHLGVDPEVDLRATAERFIGRFKAMERDFTNRAKDIADASPVELEQAWRSAKLEAG